VFCPFDGAHLEDAQRPPDQLDPLIGETIDGRYAIQSVVGGGGGGTVYRARHVGLSRSLALKVLRADLAQDTELSARFLQEAQATAAIKHPNVVSITDFGRLPDNRPYFVMELLAGRTLASLVRAGGALPPRAAARVAIAIAQGLEAAHAAGVIHRDLKPENVFVLDDEAKEVRVVDFGAALIVGASRLTKQGVVFGTPYYMSPEQAAGKEVDHRCDIYALGVIFYEMLTGRVPFEGDTYMGVLTQHMFALPRPPSQAVPDLDGKLGAVEAVVLRALAKDPNERYATMSELEAAIAGALDARVAGPSWPARAPKGIADDLELPTLLEIRERVSDFHEPPRRPIWPLVVVAGALIAIGAVAGLVVTRNRSASTPALPRPSMVSTPTTPVTSPIPPIPTPPVVPVETESVALPAPTPTKTAEPHPKPPKPHVETTKLPINTLGPDPFEQR